MTLALKNITTSFPAADYYGHSGSKTKYRHHFFEDSLEEAMDLIRIIIAVFIPPLGVFLQVGFGTQFWINIVLTLLGYLPGIVHAIWVIAKY